MDNTERFRRARDVLVAASTDYARACREFIWPRFTVFNWAIDWFDAIARDNARTALRVIDEDGSEECLSFDQLRCPLIPATTLLSTAEIRDRMERGQVRAVVTEAGCADRFEPRAEGRVHLLASGEAQGWRSLSAAYACSEEFVADGSTQADELLLLYFTSGTTAKPKLVAHTHVSYPVGHLTTLYWIGLKPGDVHLNLSSAGWAKHAWSCLFAPWNAEATVVAIRSGRFDAARLLATLVRCEVTTFCAPPTVWRALIQQPLKSFDVKLREALSAGEPLNPEVIAQVRDAWGITLRDGYGQTETTLQIGNFPGQPLEAGAMGRPAPGCRVRLLDADGNDAREGEVSIELGDDPVCLMAGYLDDSERTRQVMQHGCYRTGDVARVGADGRYTFVGRNDDVFKSSDYRISPFELESVLIEHDAVVEAAVVPSPDPQRLCVPKAFVVIAPDRPADAMTARSILNFVRERVAPYKRVRRIEFAELPKTISGKIRRVELREAEFGRTGSIRKEREFWEEDLRD